MSGWEEELIRPVLRKVKLQMPEKMIIREIMDLLLGRKSDDELQGDLVDLLGFEALDTDVIQALMSIRGDIKAGAHPVTLSEGDHDRKTQGSGTVSDYRECGRQKIPSIQVSQVKTI